MSKRLAAEALGDDAGNDSPASKRYRGDSTPGFETEQNGDYQPDLTMAEEGAQTADREANGMDIDGYEQEEEDEEARAMANKRDRKSVV